MEVFLGYSVTFPGELVRMVHEQTIDALVMGGHGHRGIADLLFGSTISPVRHELDIPSSLSVTPLGRGPQSNSCEKIVNRSRPRHQEAADWPANANSDLAEKSGMGSSYRSLIVRTIGIVACALALHPDSYSGKEMRQFVEDFVLMTTRISSNVSDPQERAGHPEGSA